MIKNKDNEGRKRTRSKGKYYVNKDEMMAEFLKSLEQDRMTEKFGEIILLVATKLSMSGRFVGYSYRDDMVNQAVMSICSTWRGYKPEKSPQIFSYFTQCCWNSFLQTLNYQKKHRDIRDNLMVLDGLNPSDGYTERHREDMEKYRKEHN